MGRQKVTIRIESYHGPRRVPTSTMMKTARFIVNTMTQRKVIEYGTTSRTVQILGTSTKNYGSTTSNMANWSLDFPTHDEMRMRGMLHSIPQEEKLNSKRLEIVGILMVKTRIPPSHPSPNRTAKIRIDGKKPHLRKPAGAIANSG